MGRTMAAIFTKQSGIRAVSVGADAHIGPLGSYEFAEDSRKIGTSCGWTRGIRPYRGRARVVVGADDSVGPLGSRKFAGVFHKKTVRPAGPMCTGKRQTHIRNAPSSRTAVTGIGPYSWRGSARGSRASAKIRSCSAASSRGSRGPSWSRWSARRWQGRNGRP